jgi:glycosyltransferase involved in cell wall biosynthesis
MAKPTMLFLITDFQIGGIQKAAVSFLQALKDDFQISVFVFSNAGPLRKEIPPEIPVIDGGGRFRFFGESMAEAKQKGPIEYLKRGLMARRAKKQDSFRVFDQLARDHHVPGSFDFCVSYTQIEDGHHLYAFGTPSFALRCVDAKTKIQFIHDDLAQEEKRNPVLGALYSQFAALFVFSSIIQERARSFIKAPVFVIANFFDIEDARRALSQKGPRTALSSPDVRILVLARLTPDKGISRLIEAISKGRDLFARPFSVHIYGEGVEEGRIHQEILSHHVEDIVSLSKPALNPLETMDSFDALLLCSYHEAHPMVVDEAHLMGKTVLALDYASAKEQLFSSDLLWENDEKSLQNGLISFVNHFERKNNPSSLPFFEVQNEDTRKRFLSDIGLAPLDK